MNNRGGTTDHDKGNLMFSEGSEKGAEIGHAFRDLASRPARRNSSAKRAKAVAF